MPIVLREFLLNTMPPPSPRRSSIREVLANGYALGDLLENICIAIMLKTYPRIPDVVAWVCCVGNVVKNIASWTAVLMIVYEGVLWIARPKQKKR